ncbi:RNA polymerase sigma factor [Hypericibacter adhaerens]|uniref:RNA polymerase sigma factor n=1 Tax=Hypericibacter adhaerens TaxID=2602016 RepID=A0A5J6N543_9PROT|nr:RNA polymerase factor sigma-32 [Hypericibacter adhaerens]QEX22026.1 RNA polymerase sigma factor [Hypericibacter adhaerens]
MGNVPGSSTDRLDRNLLRYAMKLPTLSAEEEGVLTRAWADDHDESALQKLVSAHLRMVISQAARYRSYGLAFADLVQEGTVGLMQAAERFDPERQVRFSTYAIWWIRAAIQDYVLRNWSVVRVGTTHAEKRLFFNLRRLRAKIAQSGAGTLNPEQAALLARELDVSLDVIETIDARLSARDCSVNEPFGENGDGEWQDLIADERASPEEQTTSQLDSQTRSRWLAAAMRELPDREQIIIRKRHLAENGATLEDLSHELGVSKERVRQLEKRALGRLQAILVDRETAV